MLVAACLVACGPPEYTLDGRWSGYWRQDGSWCARAAFAGDGNRSTECRAAFGMVIPDLTEPVILAKVRFDIRRYVGPSREQCDQFLADRDRARFEAQCIECVDLVALDQQESIAELRLGSNSVLAFEDAGDGARFGRFCATPEDAGGEIERLLSPAAISEINRAGFATDPAEKVFAFGIVSTSLDEDVDDEGILFESASEKQLELWIRLAPPHPGGDDSAQRPGYRLGQHRDAWLDLVRKR
jgi:hypothetical protein